ncbi:MAG: redoxin domain-containing protein [bacterium]
MRLKNISTFIFVSVLLINILVVCSCASRPETVAVKPFRQIDGEEFLRIVEKNPGIQVVDVRSANYRQMVYIRGSKHIPLENLESRIGEIDLSKPLIVYCQTGQKSVEAVKMLTAQNPVELMELGGGISQMFTFLATEPWKLLGTPDKKFLYDRLRGLIVTGEAVVGLPMPDASFTDINGNKVSVGKIKGKPVLFAFFPATDLKLFNKIAALAAAYRKKFTGLNFIAVAITKNEGEEKSLKKYLRTKKWKGQIYIDAQGTNAGRLGISEFPAFSLIDAGGVIRMHNVIQMEGPVDSCHDRTLEEMAGMVASGKLPPYPMSDAELSGIRQMKLVGAVAPAFSLPDAKEKNYSLSTYNTGGGILLIFGTLHCPFTVRELIVANSCSTASSPSGGFKVMAVLAGSSFQEANEIVQFASEHQINYPMLMDSSGEAFKKYSISSVPVWWVIRQDGVIRHREIGFAEATCKLVAQALEK